MLRYFWRQIYSMAPPLDWNWFLSAFCVPQNALVYINWNCKFSIYHFMRWKSFYGRNARVSVWWVCVCVCVYEGVEMFTHGLRMRKTDDRFYLTFSRTHCRWQWIVRCHFFFPLVTFNFIVFTECDADDDATRSANGSLFTFCARVEHWHHRCVRPFAYP